MRRSCISILATLAVLAGLCVVPADRPAAADTGGVRTAVWTASSYDDVFADALPTDGSPRSLSLVAARNEYEAGQILVRKSAAFTIQGVGFSALSSGEHRLAAGELHYQFVDDVHLNHNSSFAGSQPVDLVTRKAPGDFPDGLSDDATRAVGANVTQPIWIRVHVPKDTPAGHYTGTATVHTDHGDSAVPIGVDVEDVTIPDAADSGMTTCLWMLTVGSLSWDEGKGDTIALYYGLKRYSAKWWRLMGEFAKDMREYRNNCLTVNVVRLLLDGGSTVDKDGSYTFDWTRFDQYVQFFLDRHAVKALEGYWMSTKAFGAATRQTETIGLDAKGKPARTWVPWDSAAAHDWDDQFVPALRDHLKAKGWDDRWWMHIGDEPTGADDITAWKSIAERVRRSWPDVRLSDAVYDQGSAEALAPSEDFLIAGEFAFGPHEDYYDQQVASGKQVWLYNANIPTGMYLNRFIDQPVYDQRLTMWYAYEHGLTGYLHWALNNWQYEIDDEDVKGDGYITLPDKANNTLRPTIRYESLRDGLEDKELLTILGKRDAALAQGIAHSVVTTANRYSRDTAYMRRIRAMLVSAAAGESPFADDLAHGRDQTASTVDGRPAVTVDLGAQAQVDAVHVVDAPKAFDVQVSYDGEHWASAATNAGDGAFVGLDTKARYVRVVGGGSRIAVAGSKPALPNLAGGRPYTVTPTPSHADAGRDSTDGVLAGQWSDHRSYGYDLAKGDTVTADVTVDLGDTTPVADVKVHRYQDYEYRYSPDSVRIATSADGTHFTQKGALSSRSVNGPDGLWYDFTFPATRARYVRVSLTKAYAAGADALFVDEVEAYPPAHPEDTDVALGKRYARSAEPDDPMFGDPEGTESTDGVIAGDLTDGHGYAYYLGGGQTRTVTFTVDLGSPVAVDLVRFRKYVDGVHDYAPDTVSVSTRVDGGDWTPRGTTSWANGLWYDVGFDRTPVRYVRIDVTKSDGHFADYLFVDEIAVLGDLAASPQNLVAGRAYTKSGGVDPSYPDTGGGESTDGVIAGGYPDGKSYGYDLTPGETRTVFVAFDLGAAHSLDLVKFWRYNDGSHHYQPDTVTVLTSDDGTTYTKRATSTTPDDRWFSLALDGVRARYVKVEATKTYGYFADYIFVDEIEVYGT